MREVECRIGGGVFLKKKKLFVLRPHFFTPSSASALALRGRDSRNQNNRGKGNGKWDRRNMTLLPDLRMLSINIGAKCKAGGIAKQRDGSCFFFAVVACTRYALDRMLKARGADGLDALQQSKPEFYRFIAGNAEDWGNCVKDPKSTLPTRIFEIYKDLLFAEWESGVFPDPRVKAIKRRKPELKFGFAWLYEKGATGPMLLEELEKRKRDQDKWRDALQTHGEEMEDVSEYSFEGIRYDNGGHPDLMALSILIASDLPMVYYSNELPILDEGADNNALRRHMRDNPIPGPRLLMTMPRPIRFTNQNTVYRRFTDQKTVYSFDDTKAKLDDIVRASRATEWPNRELLSGMLVLREIVKDQIDGHVVAIFPCPETEDYRVCDSANGMCYDTLKEFEEYRRETYSPTELMVTAIILFWYGGEIKHPSVSTAG